MMRAELRGIEHNDFADWQAFVDHCRGSTDGYGWLTVSIGKAGHPGTDLFQVLIAVPRAISMARKGGQQPVFVVETFEPDTIMMALREYVASLDGVTWDAIVAQLREIMLWEFERMPSP